MGFMVFKSTGSDSRFQRKNRFRKIYTECQDITKKGSKIRDSEPADLNTMNPIIFTIFFLPLKGSGPNFGGNSGFESSDLPEFFFVS